VPKVRPEVRTGAPIPATLTDVATQPHTFRCVAELTTYEVKYAAMTAVPSKRSTSLGVITEPLTCDDTKFGGFVVSFRLLTPRCDKDHCMGKPRRRHTRSRWWGNIDYKLRSRRYCYYTNCYRCSKCTLATTSQVFPKGRVSQ